MNVNRSVRTMKSAHDATVCAAFPVTRKIAVTNAAKAAQAMPTKIMREV